MVPEAGQGRPEPPGGAAAAGGGSHPHSWLPNSLIKVPRPPPSSPGGSPRGGGGVGAPAAAQGARGDGATRPSGFVRAAVVGIRNSSDVRRQGACYRGPIGSTTSTARRAR